MAQQYPNVVFVLTDQWRAQATGYAGDTNVRTPNLDRFASESVVFPTAVSSCPVCSPARASLMTGRYPLSHGVFVNDVSLNRNAVSIAEAFNEVGYDTAYIGKWHLDGHGRSAFIPPERRQGFNVWEGTECNHDYYKGYYYSDRGERVRLEGYEPEAQTREARKYLSRRANSKPFALFVSWAPPHNPYHTSPEEFRERVNANMIVLRPNVPLASAESARKDLAGYYGHIMALDACFGDLLQTLNYLGLRNDTIVVFTSDHGDMLGSQGATRKQHPYDESILVPFVMSCPSTLGVIRKSVEVPFSTADILPTILGLCGIEKPSTSEGVDFSGFLRGRQDAPVEAALVACYMPFGEWSRDHGGREFRGVRTRHHTYVRDLEGPWLLFDNEKDPYQMENLCSRPKASALQEHLEQLLSDKLAQTRDEFLPGETYIEIWGYPTDETGTVPYTP